MTIQKLMKIETALNERFIEREKEIRAILLAIVTKQNALLIGEAGTAKSAVVTSIFKSIESSNYFERLLSPVTAPEELFGSVKLDGLEQGIYERNTTFKLPEANFAFLDEIFKCNSAILNSLLKISNEHIYENGNTIMNVPMHTIVGASNEYPEEESLGAFFDRFLIRRDVKYISNPQNFTKMLQASQKVVDIPTITLEELEDVQFEVDLVKLGDDIIFGLSAIRQDLINEGFCPSDRRFTKSLSLIKGNALLNGRTVALMSDLDVLKDTLWNDIEQYDLVASVIDKYSKDSVSKAMEDHFKALEDLYNRAMQEVETQTGAKPNKKWIEYVAKAKNCVIAIKELQSDVTAKGMWNDSYEADFNDKLAIMQNRLDTIVKSGTKM